MSILYPDPSAMVQSSFSASSVQPPDLDFGSVMDLMVDEQPPWERWFEEVDGRGWENDDKKAYGSRTFWPPPEKEDGGKWCLGQQQAGEPSENWFEPEVGKAEEEEDEDS